jgi:hypothetical protein
MTGLRGRRGEGRGRVRARVLGLAAGLTVVCLVAAAGLAGATTPNGSRAVLRDHERARLAAAMFSPGERWSGYVVNGGANFEVSATFTVPMLYCQSWQNAPGTGFWVGIESNGSNNFQSLVQDGIEVFCVNGQPKYAGTMVQDAYHEFADPLPNPLQPGDAVTATVLTMDGLYLMQVSDQTENWSEFRILTGGDASSNSTAAVAAESWGGGAFFNPMAVTNATLNWAPLGQSNYETWEEDPSIYQGTAGLDPSSLDPSGEDFSFFWNGPPNLAP